jgi:hypothetical protein
MMKNICYLVSLLLLFNATNLKAQKDLRFGVKGGLNMATFSSGDLSDQSLTARYHAGLYGRIPLPLMLSLQAEALYSLKGTAIEESFGQTKINGDVELGYVDLAAIVNFKILKVILLQGGFSLGFLTNASVANNSDAQGTTNLEQILPESSFNDLDPGYLLGIEFDIKRLSLGFRYTHSLDNITSDVSYPGFPELRNTVYQTYVGLRLLRGK